jgi:hypothetical protein
MRRELTSASAPVAREPLAEGIVLDMKTARWYGILCLSFCLWLLLFPPWMERYDSQSFLSLGHHWRFSHPSHWEWRESAHQSFLVPNRWARIDYQQMLYEAAIGLVALALLFLLLPALEMPIRRIRLR